MNESSGELICLVHVEEMFETFTPIWSHYVTENKQNMRFHKSFNNFGKHPPYEYRSIF